MYSLKFDKKKKKYEIFFRLSFKLCLKINQYNIEISLNF